MVVLVIEQKGDLLMRSVGLLGARYPAKITRRAKVDEKFADVIGLLIQRGHLTAHPASAVGIDRPKVVFCVGRPHVVLTTVAKGCLDRVKTG